MTAQITATLASSALADTAARLGAEVRARYKAGSLGTITETCLDLMRAPRFTKDGAA